MGGLVCYWWDLKLLQEVWKTGIPTKVEDIMHALQIINSNPRNRSTKIHAHGCVQKCSYQHHSQWPQTRNNLHVHPQRNGQIKL